MVLNAPPETYDSSEVAAPGITIPIDVAPTGSTTGLGGEDPNQGPAPILETRFRSMKLPRWPDPAEVNSLSGVLVCPMS